VHSYNVVNTVIEFTFPLVKEFVKVFQSLMDVISSQFMIYLSVAMKTENIGLLLENKPLNNGFGLEAQLRVDINTRRNLREIGKKYIESNSDIIGNDYMPYVMMLLFEELKLEAKIEKAYDVLKTFGVPEQINVKESA
jgi:hypothetical protein